MSITPKVFVVGALVLAGMVYSVYDYSLWRKEEYGKYGQGTSDVNEFKASQTVDKWYQNELVSLRVGYPATWTVVESKNKASLLIVGDGQASVKVSLSPSDLSVTDAVNSLVLPPLQGDRQYINTETAHLIILTWVEGENTVQGAYFKHRDDLVTIRSTVSTSAWKTYAKTFWSIYESIVLF